MGTCTKSLKRDAKAGGDIMIKTLALIRLFLYPYKNTFLSSTFNILALPILMMVFLSLITGQSGRGAVNILVGSLSMSIISLCVNNLAMKINQLTEFSGIDFFMSFNVSKAQFIYGTLIADILVYIPGLIITLIFGSLLLGLNIDVGFYFVVFFALTVFLFVGSLRGFGAVIGFRANGVNDCSAKSSALNFSLILLSPIFFSTDVLPGVLRYIAQVLPTTHGATLLRMLLSGELHYNQLLISFSVLVGYCILNSILIKLFIK